MVNCRKSAYFVLAKVFSQIIEFCPEITDEGALAEFMMFLQRFWDILIIHNESLTFDFCDFLYSRKEVLFQALH